MHRFRGPALGLLIGILAIPYPALGQTSPRDDRFTREADKHLTITLVATTSEEDKLEAYRAALEVLRPGFTEAADNPRIWLLAGQAHAGLMNFAAADSAFTRALELWPEYEPEIEAHREQGWIKGFEAGVALMEQQQLAEAADVLEKAHRLYPRRPEGALNLGMVFANLDQLDRAEWAYEQAIEAVNGPLFEKLDSAGQAQWKQYERMATENIAALRGQQGVKAFGANNFDDAVTAFQRALEVNPHSRDYMYNIVQARFAKAQTLEEARDTSAAPGQAAQDAELIRIYTQIEPDIRKVLEYDPNNQNVIFFLIRAHGRLGELKGAPEEGRAKAREVLAAAEQLTLFLRGIHLEPGEGNATIQGTLENQSLEPGQPVRVRFTVLGFEGGEIATHEISITAPEKEATVEFRETIPGVAGSIAGWKYMIVR